jgi:hypothetical protein
MNKLFLIIFLILVGCNSSQQTPIDVEDIKEVPRDYCIVVPCMECDGSGIFEYKADDPMVELGMVEEGLEESCQTCKGLGKLKKCTTPNGMVYHMSM